MNTPLLSMSGVSKTFLLHRLQTTRLPVLQNVNLEVAPGECVVLDGPSGMGKSTLLKLVYANYLPSSGSIRIRIDRENESDSEGEYIDVAQASSRQLLSLRRDTLGYVSQFLRAIPRVPALEVVAEPLLESAGEDDALAQAAKDVAQRLLSRLRIPRALWSLPPATFSGGEQQRVNIARGFAKPKPLMLLDEPTASLDSQNTSTAIELINESRRNGAAIVGIFHDRAVREAVATRTVDMRDFQATA